MTDFQQNLQQISELINQTMKDLLPKADNDPRLVLIEAMNYSTLSHGKRLRPFLTVISSSLFGVSQDSALRIASSIEFVHAYSMIHDDLPAMDNDDERRGAPSCHVKFGEAAAILAGDALLTLAFEVISDKATHPDSNVRCELITALSRASGYQGMAGGQMLDILSLSHEFSVNETVRMQRMKTGELFAVACEAGAIAGKASKNLRMALRGYALALGQAFQVTDDILDFNQDNNPSKLNIGNSQAQVAMLINQAISHLNVFEEKADPLRQLAGFIVERNK